LRSREINEGAAVRRSSFAYGGTDGAGAATAASWRSSGHNAGRSRCWQARKQPAQVDTQRCCYACRAFARLHRCHAALAQLGQRHMIQRTAIGLHGHMLANHRRHGIYFGKVNIWTTRTLLRAIVTAVRLKSKQIQLVIFCDSKRGKTCGKLC